MNTTPEAERRLEVDLGGEHTVNDLARALEQFPRDKALVIQLPGNDLVAPTDIAGWRGHEGDLALGYDVDPVGKPVVVGGLLNDLYDVSGTEYPTYKGYPFTGETDCQLWIDNWGDYTGGRYPASVEDRPLAVVIVVAEADWKVESNKRQAAEDLAKAQAVAQADLTAAALAFFAMEFEGVPHPPRGEVTDRFAQAVHVYRAAVGS